MLWSVHDSRAAHEPGETGSRTSPAAFGPGVPVAHGVQAEGVLSGVSMSFANQVAVVTGASSGIGWALAKVLAAEGCKVGLIARRKEKLHALAEDIRTAGGTAALASTDVGDRTQTLEAVQELSGQLGLVDLLIANAGVGMPTVLQPVNVADVEKMFRVNVLGLVYSIEAVLPEMRRRGRGHLAAVASP